MNSSFGFDKIICAGKNYLEHAKELGDDVPDRPVFFFKPPSCLVDTAASAGKPVPIPRDHGSVHHECEIVYRIRVRDGRASFDAVTLGLDLTLRDLQNDLKKKGHPWEACKAFHHAAVIGPWVELSRFEDCLNVPFELKVNGSVRQSARGSEMATSPAGLLEEAHRFFHVCDGDLLFTGTPKGVGPVLPGDRLSLGWGNRLQFEVMLS